MIAAEPAVRAWINSKATLVGIGQPLSNGAFLREQKSPASGCYAVIAQGPTSPGPVAEPSPNLSQHTIGAMIYGGTQDTALAAATAYASAVEQLLGCPEACGSTGVKVLAAMNVTGPAAQPWAPDTGEQFAYLVTAQFLLAA